MNTIKEWHIEAVTADEFDRITENKIVSIYNTAAFNRINESDIYKVWYLIVYKGNSPRFSAILGERDNTVFMPFSAPFGYPEVLKKDMGLEDYYKAYDLTRDFLKKNDVTGAEIYMAPDFYDMDVITAWNNILIQNGFNIQCYDQNYSFFDIQKLMNDYELRIQKNAKKNLRIALDAGTRFIKCSNDEEWTIAYDVIRQNRIARRHPLRMTLDKIMKVRPIVNSEMFLAVNGTDYIAAALIYPVTKDIAQVIYWGDMPGHESQKPTNFMSYELLKYCASKGYKHLDVGISTVEGKPNFGLCDFKESIGCTRNGKIRFVKKV